MRAAQASEEDETRKSVLEAFNQSVDQEVAGRIQESEEAEKQGNEPRARELLREAMILESLKAEEKSMSEEKILALKENMAAGEKKVWIDRFIKEGDRLAGLGLYDSAVEEYEKVFLLDSGHGKASERIDILKKQFIEEEKRVLDEEVRAVEQELKQRVTVYLNQAEELIKAGNVESARRVLERLLVLDSRNKKAKNLLRSINKKQ